MVKNLPANIRDAGHEGLILGQEDGLEEEMATHSVFLPGKPHQQGSLAGYSPKGHRVRHDLATEHKYYLLQKAYMNK